MTPTDYSELVKRLRARHNPTFIATMRGNAFTVSVNPDGGEAATAIRALSGKGV